MWCNEAVAPPLEHLRQLSLGQLQSGCSLPPHTTTTTTTTTMQPPTHLIPNHVSIVEVQHPARQHSVPVRHQPVVRLDVRRNVCGHWQPAREPGISTWDGRRVGSPGQQCCRSRHQQIDRCQSTALHLGPRPQPSCARLTCKVEGPGHLLGEEALLEGGQGGIGGVPHRMHQAGLHHSRHGARTCLANAMQMMRQPARSA